MKPYRWLLLNVPMCSQKKSLTLKNKCLNFTCQSKVQPALQNKIYVYYVAGIPYTLYHITCDMRLRNVFIYFKKCLWKKELVPLVGSTWPSVMGRLGSGLHLDSLSDASMTMSHTTSMDHTPWGPWDQGSICDGWDTSVDYSWGFAPFAEVNGSQRETWWLAVANWMYHGRLWWCWVRTFYSTWDFPFPMTSSSSVARWSGRMWV